MSNESTGQRQQCKGQPQEEEGPNLSTVKASDVIAGDEGIHFAADTTINHIARGREYLLESPQQERGVGTLSGGQGRVGTSSAEEPDPGAMEELRACELKSLSLEERTAVYEDVHGVTTVEEETPEAVTKWIEEFHEAIRKIRVKPDFEKAVFVNQNCVINRDNILMFLRAEDYNVKKAAQRMIIHYKHKLDLFGIDKVSKRITFDDLSEDDQEAAMTGFYQKLELPDQSGRTVIMAFPHLLRFKSAINEVRALWYFLMSAVQGDHAAQRNGFVAVVYCAGITEPSDALAEGRLALGIESSFLIDAIPYKIRGFHFCYDSSVLRSLLAIMQMAIGSRVRLRARTHYGSHTECKYALATFGIPVTLIPLDDNGNMNMTSFNSMMSRLRQSERHAVAQEKAEEAQGRIHFPSADDVLLGRGKPYQDFPGNLRLAKVVESHRQIYKAQGKRHKPAYTQKLVDIIKNDFKGRFLKKVVVKSSSSSTVESDPMAISSRNVQETNAERTLTSTNMAAERGVPPLNLLASSYYWEEVSDEVARDKVGHSFRTKTKRLASGSSAGSGDGDDEDGDSSSSAERTRSSNSAQALRTPAVVAATGTGTAQAARAARPNPHIPLFKIPHILPSTDDMMPNSKRRRKGSDGGLRRSGSTKLDLALPAHSDKARKMKSFLAEAGGSTIHSPNTGNSGDESGGSGKTSTETTIATIARKAAATTKVPTNPTVRSDAAISSSALNGLDPEGVRGSDMIGSTDKDGQDG